MSNVKQFVEDARKAIVEGRLDDAQKLTEQAKAMKALEPFDVAAEPVRLPMGEPAAESQEKETPASIKTWYQKRFGEPSAANAQVAKELYGDFMALSYAKSQDFRKYVRYGVTEGNLSRQLVYSPNQIVDAVGAGFSVKEMKAAQVESTDTLGGYIVPEDFRADIIARLSGLTVMRKLGNVLTTSSDRLVIPKATGGDSRYIGAVRATWVDESPTAGTAATNATFGQITIPVHTQMMETAVSRPMLEDPAFSIETHLAMLFANAKAINEDEQFLVGNGLGKPSGVLKDNSTGGPSDSDTQTKSTSTAITADGIASTPYLLDAQYRANGVWVFNKTTVGVARGLKDSQNRYLWSDNIQNLASGQPNQLAGYPLYESEALPSAATNKYIGIFGDFKGYTVADRIGMSVERYLDSATARANQAIFIARCRLGGQVSEGWRFVVYQTT